MLPPHRFLLQNETSMRDSQLYIWHTCIGKLGNYTQQFHMQAAGSCLLPIQGPNGSNYKFIRMAHLQRQGKLCELFAVSVASQKTHLQTVNILLFLLKHLPTWTTFTSFADGFIKESCMSSKCHELSLFKQSVCEVSSKEPCFTEALLDWQGAPSNSHPSSLPRKTERTFVPCTTTQDQREKHDSSSMQ